MKKILGTVLLCAAISTPVLAQSAYPYYGALDFGIVNVNGASSPGAMTVSGGYRYSSNLAFEAGYTIFGDVSVSVPGSGNLSVTQSMISAVAVGTLPLDRDFNLFGKLGLGLHNGDMNGLPDDLIYGIGAQFNHSSRWSLRAQYENLGKARLVSSVPRAEMSRFSVGAMYNF
jgi:opacity protein-like surface antigen